MVEVHKDMERSSRKETEVGNSCFWGDLWTCSALWIPAQEWSCWNESRGGTKIVRGMEHLYYEKMLELFILEKLLGNLIVAFQYLKAA